MLKVTTTFFLFALFGATFSHAAVPGKLHYNGYLTNAVGEVVDCPDVLQCDTSYNLTFRIYDDPSAEVSLWEETHVAVPIYMGHFHVMVGSNNLLQTNHLSGARYVGITINAGAEMIPRQELASAAFAFHAEQAESAQNANQLGGIDASEYLTGPPTVDTTLTESQVDLMVANNGYAEQSAIDTTIASLQNELIAAQESLNTLQADLEALNNTVSGQGSAQSELLSAIETLQSNIDAVQSNLTALDNSLAPVAKTGLPSDLADGDDNTDTLSELVCTEGQIPKRTGDAWACADDAAGTVSTEEPTSCDSGSVGQMYFDAVGQTLKICDGVDFKKIKICSEVCPAASSVLCNVPIEDDCGVACGGTGTAFNEGQCADLAGTACGTTPTDECGNDCLGQGTACPTGSTCVAEQCLYHTSCAAILDAGLATGTGIYTIDPDGLGSNAPFQVHCDMDLQGGGWTLISLISSDDGIAKTNCGEVNWEYGDSHWTSGSVLNETEFDHGKDRKYLSYSTLAFSEFLMKEEVAGNIGWKAWDVGSQSSFSNMMNQGCQTLATSHFAQGGAISPSNALIYSNNLVRNCNSDYINGDDKSRLHGNSPNNPDGLCYNGGWGLGVTGDNHCGYSMEARPQKGGWSNQCYGKQHFYTGGNVWPPGGISEGHFYGHLYVR